MLVAGGHGGGAGWWVGLVGRWGLVAVRRLLWCKMADAQLHEALRCWSVGLFTEERTLRERLQWVKKREAQVVWREVSLI